MSGARADVEDGAISMLEVALAGDFGGNQMAAPDELGMLRLSLLEPGKVFLRNHEHVGGRLWIDVLKSKHVLVLVHFFGRRLTAKNPAKQAVDGGIVHKIALWREDSISRQRSAGLKRQAIVAVRSAAVLSVA